MKPCGSLTVVCGCMYAGKSEELIRRARRFLYAGRRLQVFKPQLDDRYDSAMVVSHMGARHEAVPVAGVADLRTRIAPDTEAVCIDEVQFFDPGIVELAVELADRGLSVVCAGLDQDFRRRPFGPMAELLCVADEVVKLKAICMKCGAEASHTFRMIEGRPAHINDPIIVIGATEKYEARCRRCHTLRGEKRRRS